MKDWICRHCGHEVMAENKPQPIRWTDGHVCDFIAEKIKIQGMDFYYSLSLGKYVTVPED